MRRWRSAVVALCLTFGIGGAGSVLGGVVVAGSAWATPADLYVSPSGTSSDACTTADPCDLATALSLVDAGVTVLFTASGTYASTGGSSFTIAGSVSGSDPVTLAAGPGVSGVVLDGTTAEADGNPILAIDTSTPVVIDGLAFDNADPSASTVGSGGAIDDPAAPLTVENSTFSGNAASTSVGNGNGGAIDVGDGAGTPVSLTVDSSTFSDNTAANNGGAIDIGDNATAAVSLDVENSTFSDNATANYGGAIDEGNSATAAVSLTVDGSTFSDNTAPGGSGGAVDAANGTTGSSGAVLSATIEQSTFTATSPSNDVVAGQHGGLVDLGDGNSASSVSIESSQFTATSTGGGTVAQNGAAVDIADDSGTAASVDIEDSQFTSTASANQAVVAANGGAVDIADGGGTATSVTIAGSQFTSTASTQPVAGNDGGAVDIADNGTAGTVSITGSTFTLQPGSSSMGSPGMQVAGADGGAVDIADNGTVGTVSIAHTQFLGTPGPVPTAWGSGGAVDIADQPSGTVTSSVSIQDVTASGVSTGNGGGAIAVLEGASTNSTAPITVAGSTFSHDRAVGNNGGALDLGTDATGYTGPLTVSDSTFDNDTAGSGGAIGTQSTAVTVEQSTFSDDVSTAGNGGAIDTGTNTLGPVAVTGSTLVEPVDGSSYLVNGSGVFTLAGDILDGPCNQAAGTWNDQGWNVTTDASCTNGGSGDVAAGSGLDALLAAPADNGGPTETVLPLAGNRAIGLIPNGTSVTVGGSSLALCPVTSDQRGLSSTTGSACNAGALQPTTQTVSITSGAPSAAAAGGSSYAPTATASSALPVAFSATPAEVCTVSGGAVQFLSAGTCVLDATQAGNAAWSAASASQSFTVAAASSAPSGPGSGSGSGGGSTPPPPATLPPLPPTIPTDTFGTPATGTASATSTTAITGAAGSASAEVDVPAGALPAGTTVSLTPVVETTAVTGLLPAGDGYVVSFAVSWEAPDGSAPVATAPIELTVSDPSITAGDVVYEVTAAGSLQAVGKATTNGTVTVTFSHDPLFVAAAPPKVTLSNTHAVVKGHAVRLSLRCVRGSTCEGTASIDLAHAVTRHGKTYSRPVLAKAHFTIPHGRVVALKLTLTKLGRSLLTGTKRRVVRVTLLTTVTSGARTTRSLRLTY